jgi:lysophospholipase L1-like esterase
VLPAVRRLALAAIVAAALAGTAAARTVSVKWPAHGPLHVLFVGDSITVGDTAIDPRNQFREQVIDWLETHGRVTAVKDGRGGVRVAYWAARKLPAGMNLVIIELGTNDFFAERAPTAVDFARFDRQYRWLVSHIRRSSPRAKLVCLSLWHPAVDGGSTMPWNAIIRRDCAGGYVNITDLGTKAHLAADGFHPNDVAHKLIAARIERIFHVR